jgi:hypothetical protein
MNQFIESLAKDPSEAIGLLIAVISVVGGLIIGWVAVLGGLRNAREAERTRREVAAYVAEGSMTAEDAAKLLGTRPGAKK